ncbi:ArgK protein [Conidiobolus coronatus NRRL 28638]|uniref:ArgK protein n=1 Tax=Conidiobolus coronatus (strain ATCC 28846 / CBS 209.66 / NRRL 28638) TaxID=796925 RepID=A0A137P7C6_CONC2|nr:ArgK protein [Conidiobolus coronatus NRRL 28638]|eukprot:KXN70910.1 ArgK protein [Conidiobolus coronatus NRRL 28638]
MNSTKKTFRIGLSGAPGVGKSTFIESFGMHLINQGFKVAVLAVDPSSTRTGGSILGDKTRMPELSKHDNAYVRPSPSRGTLGGVARNTNEAILLCEAGGYDIILVETVGVGQSETLVADMVDMFVLLVPPAGGDELQGLKKGIVELSDLIIINKCDGDLINAANRAQAEYISALKFIQPLNPSWKPQAIKLSSLKNDGIDKAWLKMQEFNEIMQSSGDKFKKRGTQQTLWMWREVTSLILGQINQNKELKAKSLELEEKVFNNEITYGMAADKILTEYFKLKTSNDGSNNTGAAGDSELLKKLFF